MSRDGIEADVQHPRNILVSPSDCKKAQHLDLTGRKVVWKADVGIRRAKKRIDVVAQPHHPEPTCKLLSLAHVLTPQAMIFLRGLRHQNGAEMKQRASE